MTKYEIMLLINGTLSSDEANKISKKMQAILKGAKNFKEENLGLKDMAYEIRNNKKAYYYVFNFELNDPKHISEFRRIAEIDKANILRHLIVNIEKNYGYRASINPKKIASSKIKEKKFAIYIKKIEEEKLAKKAAWEAKKAEFEQAYKTTNSSKQTNNDKSIKE